MEYRVRGTDLQMRAYCAFCSFYGQGTHTHTYTEISTTTKQKSTDTLRNAKEWLCNVRYRKCINFSQKYTFKKWRKRMRTNELLESTSQNIVYHGKWSHTSHVLFLGCQFVFRYNIFYFLLEIWFLRIDSVLLSQFYRTHKRLSVFILCGIVCLLLCGSHTVATHRWSEWKRVKYEMKYQFHFSSSSAYVAHSMHQLTIYVAKWTRKQLFLYQ